MIAQINFQCRFLPAWNKIHPHRNLTNALRLEMRLINTLRLSMRLSVERLSGPCAGDRDERAGREGATNPRGSAAGFRKRRVRPTRGRVDAAATGGEGNLAIAEPPRRKAQHAPAQEPRPPETGRAYPPHTRSHATDERPVDAGRHTGKSGCISGLSYQQRKNCGDL